MQSSLKEDGGEGETSDTSQAQQLRNAQCHLVYTVFLLRLYPRELHHGCGFPVLSAKRPNTAGKCGPCQRAEGGMWHHGHPPLNVSVSSTASDGTEVWGDLPALLLNNWRLIFITLIIHHVDC